jgi:hypothetical protein
LTSPSGLYTRWMNLAGSWLASATPRKRPIPSSAHSEASKTYGEGEGGRQQGWMVVWRTMGGVRVQG